MNLFICGDLHGRIDSVENFYVNYIKDTPRENEENWLLCLGDFGANYYFDQRDIRFKQSLCKYPFNYFVVRGNHEQRASDVAFLEAYNGWETVEKFNGECLRQINYPNIYYANDAGGIYNIAGRKTLIIPGAYSVDKYFRLQQGWSWFADEQLTPKELAALETIAAGKHFDLVLSHTCPYRYRPTDLFLNMVDQSTVDSSMELWMDQLTEKISWGVWCWGHYHADRVEAPYCEIFLNEIENLEDIEARWARYRETGELDWWIPKSPNFYMYTK